MTSHTPRRNPEIRDQLSYSDLGRDRRPRPQDDNPIKAIRFAGIFDADDDAPEVSPAASVVDPSGPTAVPVFTCGQFSPELAPEVMPQDARKPRVVVVSSVPVNLGYRHI